MIANYWTIHHSILQHVDIEVNHERGCSGLGDGPGPCRCSSRISVHLQAGFAQRTWCLLDAWRVGSGAGRRSDDIPMQFHSLNRGGDPERRPQDQ